MWYLQIIFLLKWIWIYFYSLLTQRYSRAWKVQTAEWYQYYELDRLTWQLEFSLINMYQHLKITRENSQGVIRWKILYWTGIKFKIHIYVKLTKPIVWWDWYALQQEQCKERQSCRWTGYIQCEYCLRDIWDCSLMKPQDLFSILVKPICYRV